MGQLKYNVPQHRDPAEVYLHEGKETLKSLRESEDVRVFDTYVKVDSAIEWSQDNSKPVVAYKKYSRSAIEYRSLAKEIVEYANR